MPKMPKTKKNPVIKKLAESQVRGHAAMPDYLGDDTRMMKNGGAGEGEGEVCEEEKEILILNEGEIELNPYSKESKQTDDGIQIIKRVNKLGIKESDTVLAPLSVWDFPDDKQTVQNEQQLQVTHYTKFAQESPVDDVNKTEKEDQKYVINVNQYANFLVLGTDSARPKDIEEKLRVGMDQNKFKFNIPMPPPPPKIEPPVPMIKLPEIVGCEDKEPNDQLRGVVESPLPHPERFDNLAIEPSNGPPHTVKIQKKSMSLENDDRFELLARVSPNGNSAGSDIRPAGNEMTPMIANRPKKRSATKKVASPRNEAIKQEIEEFKTLDVTPFLTEINKDLTKLGKVLYKKGKASDESSVSKAADDIVNSFAERYIDFLEKEWKKRRNAWLKRSRKCNPEEEDSVYIYETFTECVADGKIKLQVPFDLPSIHEKKHKPEPVKTVKTTEEPTKEVERSWWQSLFGSSEGGQQSSK